MGKQMIKGAAKERADKAQSSKPRARVLSFEATDFEAEFQCRIKREDYEKRLTIPLASEAKGFKAPHVEGMLATVRPDSSKASGVRVELNKIKNTEGLRQFLASKEARASRLLESDAFALGTDSLTSASTAPFPPNNEYIPIMGGPFSKQLYLFDYLDMHAKCYEAKNHNPLAKEIIDIITFFSIGKGVTIKFNNDQVQDLWDKFAERNKLQQYLRMDSDTLTWAGELGSHKTKFPDGFPRLRHIDPSTVWEIVGDPLDTEIPYYYHQQFPTQYQLTYKPGDIASAYVVNDIPADEVIWLKINTVPGEKRGRSDLFNILGWLKRFRNYYDARITKAQMEESFGLDVLIKGSANDVDDWLSDPNNSMIPRPGDKLVHNEAVEYKYIQPTASSAGNATDSIGEAIRSICATGAGLSPEYLGVGGKSGTRATAITKSEPSARKFEDRQTIFKGYIDEIIKWWKVAMPGMPTTQVRDASLGALKRALQARKWALVAKEAVALMSAGVVTEPIDMNYQIIFPEIGTEDRTAKMKDIATSQALEYLSHKRAATMTASELQITDYDYDDEQEQIRLEREERENDPLYKGDEDPAKIVLGKGGLNQAPAAEPAAGGADGSQASDAAFKAQQPES